MAGRLVAVAFVGVNSGLKLLGLNPSFATYQLCDLSQTLETLQARDHLPSKMGSYNSMCYKHTHTHFYTNTHIFLLLKSNQENNKLYERMLEIMIRVMFS